MEKCISDGGDCGIGGHCHECPHTSSDSDVERHVMRESSLNWKVRFKTPDDMYTFVNIKKSGGFALDRYEVEEWANEQVRTNPFYASVADIINEEVGA